MSNYEGGSSLEASDEPIVQEEVASRLVWSRLDDLAPYYDADLHGGYLRALVEGIEAGNATNIALSGPYGAGKSSVLDGLVKRYEPQTVQISLATVRPPEGEGDRSPSAVSTNELQKEIVKQILYVVDPRKTPESRFPRVTRFRWGKGLLWALMAGMAGIAIQWLVTMVITLSQGPHRIDWNPEVYVPTFLCHFPKTTARNDAPIVVNCLLGPAFRPMFDSE